MNAALVTFLLEQALPFVIQHLPQILNLIKQFAPTAHTQIVNTVRVHAKDQGPDFDWHSGP